MCESSVPEWKKKLILKKRAAEGKEKRSLPPESLKRVTIGNINVELRSVPLPLPVEKSSDGEDLHYGPGIVDRLRAKFLNIGVKQQRKVRRFCSLENLPGSPYRVNVRQNPVKKAQSMETLVLAEHKQAVPPVPTINEDELPKPDTVKHVKKLFESPPTSEKVLRKMPTSEKVSRKMPTTCWNSDITLRAKDTAATMVSEKSVVFDFRGRKDVEPHIALNPTPFGCKGSPDHWDELDIGADLPAFSGIVFAGENVKIGRGALLETRNKKLNIQFDDKAVVTYEYPSENSSPSPKEESDCWENSFNSMIAMSSAANSRLGLSSYTPQVLNTDEEFEFGVSQSKPRSNTTPSDKNEESNSSLVETIIPAGPNDTVEWSANETADILF